MEAEIYPKLETDSGEAVSREVGPRDLREWLELVEAGGELHRITAPVDLHEELGAITYVAGRDENAPALMFENLIDDASGIRVLSNMLGASKRRFAIAVGLDPERSITELIGDMRQRMKHRIAPVEIDPSEAPVMTRVFTGDEIDLTTLPSPKFWPRDGGAYIGTGDITLTRDPGSGRINCGVYRQMVHGPRRIGMYCSPGKHGRLDREAWWRQGESCEVVAAYGIDPVLFMVGAQTFAAEESELNVAGGIMGAPVEMAPGRFTDLPIPARAEIVIEGIVHPEDTELEGPLGEFTGYYGNVRAPQPVIDVKALYMRDSPILTAALMADYPSCEIGAYYAIGVTGVRGVYTHPAAASGWGMLVVSIEQRYAGHVAQVLALAAQCPAASYFTKWIIAVDEDVDPTDTNQVLWALSTRCNPIDNMDFQRNTWSTGLDPSQHPPEARPYGSKVMIDACKPHRHMAEFPARTMVRRSVYDQVAERWSEYGLPGSAPGLRAFEEEDE